MAELILKWKRQVILQKIYNTYFSECKALLSQNVITFVAIGCQAAITQL